MPEMTQTRMGDSGLIVSRLALGTMTFNLGSPSMLGTAVAAGQDAATEMVSIALDHGINFFDSADGYSGGDAETALGVALKGRREHAVICTKLGFRQGPAITDAGLSRRHVLRQVQGSLRRLGTDHVDLLIVHKTDFTTPMEETLRALDICVEHGHARYLGFSNWPAWEAARAIQFQRDNGLAPFVAGQLLYNAAQRDVEAELVPMMDAMGVGLMAWSPLSGGLLSGKYDPADLSKAEGRLNQFDVLGVPPGVARAALDALGAVAQAHGATPPQVAMAWILAKRRSHTVIVGASKAAHLEGAVGAATLALTPDEVRAIDDAAPPAALYPGIFLGRTTDGAHAAALA